LRSYRITDPELSGVEYKSTPAGQQVLGVPGDKCGDEMVEIEIVLHVKLLSNFRITDPKLRYAGLFFQ